MWKLLVIHRKRPNLIRTLSNVCIMVSVLLVIKSLKIVVYISLGSQDVETILAPLVWTSSPVWGVCGCLRGRGGMGRPGEGAGEGWRALWNEAHHFKGAAGREQVGGSLGRVQGQLCKGTHMWPGSKWGGLEDQKETWKSQVSPNLYLSTRISVSGIWKGVPDLYKVKSHRLWLSL